MVSSVNDKARKFILKDKNFDLILKKIMCLSYKRREYILRLLLSDCFKIFYTDYLVDGTSNGLNIFNNTIEHNLNMCMRNHDFLFLVLNSANAFFDSPLINRIIIMEELEKSKLDSKLLYMNKFHFLDKISYKFSYDLEDFKKYYIDCIKSLPIYADSHSLVSSIILDKISSLEYKNTNMYESYVIEFIREYYKWNLFRKDVVKAGPEFIHDYDYLNNVHDCSIDALLYDASKNQEFLFTIISNYLYYTSLFDKNEKDSVDKYFTENSSEKLQKKLNIKRDFK